MKIEVNDLYSLEFRSRKTPNTANVLEVSSRDFFNIA